jgi:hypothetical protein
LTTNDTRVRAAAGGLRLFSVKRSSDRHMHLPFVTLCAAVGDAPALVAAAADATDPAAEAASPAQPSL